ncbi:MAG: RNA 2'-phosphotransferase, partial [bacterium]
MPGEVALDCTYGFGCRHQARHHHHRRPKNKNADSHIPLHDLPSFVVLTVSRRVPSTLCLMALGYTKSGAGSSDSGTSWWTPAARRRRLRCDARRCGTRRCRQDRAKVGLPMDRNLVRLSKFVSLVLRHQPEIAGLTLGQGGWVEIEDLV